MRRQANNPKNKVNAEYIPRQKLEFPPFWSVQYASHKDDPILQKIHANCMNAISRKKLQPPVILKY